MLCDDGVLKYVCTDLVLCAFSFFVDLPIHSSFSSAEGMLLVSSSSEGCIREHIDNTMQITYAMAFH